MSSDVNFTVASWLLGNVHVKPISNSVHVVVEYPLSPWLTLDTWINVGPGMFGKGNKSRDLKKYLKKVNFLHACIKKGVWKKELSVYKTVTASW